MVSRAKTLGAFLTFCLLQAGCLGPAFNEAQPSLPEPEVIEPVSVTGLSNATLRTKSKTWNWACASANAPCTYRFVIDQSPTTTPPSTLSFSSVQTASQSSGTGTYYLHVQAQDQAGVLSSVKHVSAALDNSIPTVTGLQTSTSPVFPKVWSWSCTDNPSAETTCTYRYLVDQSSTSLPTGNYTSTTSVTHSTSGTWWIHVQAKDQAGNESAVVHVSASLSSSVVSLSGTATYDWVPANENTTPTALNPFPYSKLNFTGIQIRPIRRARVEAIHATSDQVLASGLTNDLGQFSLSIPSGSSAKIRVYAQLLSDSYLPDTTAPNTCNGASWNIKVVNNVGYTTTSAKPLYAITTSSSYAVNPSGGISLHAATTRSGSNYGSRSGAPFAILDTIVNQLELICQGDPEIAFPAVYVNWSVDNLATTNSNGNIVYSSGWISTSHFTQSLDGFPQLFILGKEDSDTDEYDDHVVAHEFGHYVEDALYRSDSIGGAHTFRDSLDPRVAFGEGFGNAISAMTFEDPVYVDTAGSDEGNGATSSGFAFSMNTAPQVTSNITDDSIFSETAVQHFLWRLFNDHKTVNSANPYSRFHTVLTDYQRSTPALTTVHSFAAYYHSLFGGSSTFNQRWENLFSAPIHALCAGSCSGSGDTPDLFDTDNDLGTSYVQAGMLYPANAGTVRPADFWRLYPQITSGTYSSASHNVTDPGPYGNDINKLGTSRWYRYSHSGADRTVTVSVPSIPNVDCGTDVLDMYAYQSGTLIDWDENTTGCPVVSFPAQNGTTYVIEVRRWLGSTSGFTVQVSP